MRKYLTLGIITILSVFIFWGCGNNYSYEETELEVAVIQCEKGTFHPDSSYIAIANMYLIKKNYVMWSTYTSLANANGKYDYQITVSIDGYNYTVIREEQYEVGQYIIITKLDTYQDSQLIKTEYK